MLWGLLILAFLCPEPSIYEAYAERDTSALRARLAVAPTLADSLLIRYRLYPLTQDDALIADLPDALLAGTADEYAWLSALWGYRVQRTGPVAMMRYGARSQTLLEAGRRLAPNNPWVLLVDAQSLLYRPRLVGGDPRAAGGRLASLHAVISHSPLCELPLEEVQLWQWRVAHRLGESSADSVRQVLLAGNPSALVREMLHAAW